MGTDVVPGALDLVGGALGIHIIGAGGAGMSAIAEVLVGMGHAVSGSDLQGSATLERLERLGVRTYVGHCADNLGAPAAVAYSSAIDQENVELAEARRRGIRALSRAELLAAICRTRSTVAVSGTHGKTTTTAMLVAILEAAGFRPSYIVGGDVPGGLGGGRWAQGPLLVVEADESDGTFLRLGAQGVIVTSVEADHLDFYGDLASVESAFAQFVAEARGPKVICLDEPGAAVLAGPAAGEPGGPGGLITYGTAEGSWYRVSGVSLERSSASFELSAGGEALGRFLVAAPGMHNVLDATGATAMALALGAPPAAARSALATFAPVRRRFELRGTAGGVTYIDDYAHNPGKVRAALATARHGGWSRVVAVFQPHRYTRTVALLDGFADAFVDADVVVVTAVYSAGEAPLAGVSGMLVADAVRAAHPDLSVEYVEGRSDLVELLEGLLRPGDLCLTMGAGDLTTLPDELMRRGGAEGRAGGGSQCSQKANSKVEVDEKDQEAFG